MHDRRTIATQGAEVSADFSTFEADEVLRDHLNSIELPITSSATDPTRTIAAHDASTSARWNPMV
jgi:3-isopropylmalate/(R)-2-methylmalate dehydratase large subunit